MCLVIISTYDCQGEEICVKNLDYLDIMTGYDMCFESSSQPLTEPELLVNVTIHEVRNEKGW